MHQHHKNKEKYLAINTVKQWREKAKAMAQAAEVDSYEVDWILQEVTTLTKLDLLLNLDKPEKLIKSSKSIPELTQLWQQRISERIPIQYLVGVTHWRDLTLQVSQDVLIPRPETESIIDIAVSAVEKTGDKSLSRGIWVDLGTGSGAIALGLATVFPKASIYAVDCSSKALKIAQINAEKAGLVSRINFREGSWWSPLRELSGQISGMVSNPPYIPTGLIEQLQTEVRNHEPHLALDGGQNGLNCIHHLSETAPTYLHSGGVWLVEMMVGQSTQVIEMLKQTESYRDIQVYRDLNKIERFVLAYRQ